MNPQPQTSDTVTSSSTESNADLIDDILDTGVFDSNIKDELSYETQKLLENF